MKRNKTAVCLVLLAIVVCTGCKPHGAALKEFTMQTGADYMSLYSDGVEYVPFSAAPDQIGKEIGYYEDGGRVGVCKLKGASERDWVVTALEGSGHRDAMIYKNADVIAYPSGFRSEYTWN